MSLNRAEQTLFDYVLGHAEERQHWELKVRQATKDAAKAEQGRAATAALAEELWRYYSERCTVVASLRDSDPFKGTQRMSMQNLAEHLVRQWGHPRPLTESGRVRGTPRVGPGHS